MKLTFKDLIPPQKKCGGIAMVSHCHYMPWNTAENIVREIQYYGYMINIRMHQDFIGVDQEKLIMTDIISLQRDILTCNNSNLYYSDLFNPWRKKKTQKS